MTDEPDNPNLVRLAPGITVAASVLRFSFSRGGGPGGQNVNKVNTRATLTVLLADLDMVMPGWAMARLRQAAGQYLAEDRLVITASDSRSQRANRDACIERLAEVVRRAMHRPKIRRKTRPSAGSVKRRLENKTARGRIKRLRQDRPGSHD